MPRVTTCAATSCTPAKRAAERDVGVGGVYQTAKRAACFAHGRADGLGEPDVLGAFGTASPSLSETPPPPAHLVRRKFGSQRAGEARRPKQLVHVRNGTVARALDFLDVDAAAAFTESDPKAGLSIIPTDQDGELWAALRRVAGLAPLLEGVHRIELTQLCVLTGSFTLAAPPHTRFRTADRALLARLRTLQWEPRWAELESYQLAVVRRPKRAMPPSQLPAPSQATEVMASDLFDKEAGGEEEDADADAEGGDGDVGGLRHDVGYNELVADDAGANDESSESNRVSVSSDWRRADPAAYFAMLPPDSAGSPMSHLCAQPLAGVVVPSELATRLCCLLRQVRC